VVDNLFAFRQERDRATDAGDTLFCEMYIHFTPTILSQPFYFAAWTVTSFFAEEICRQFDNKKKKSN
jgi:ABC-type transport system involved in cytochrome c biogenesis permease subunit